jgi:hypothetical protein
MWTSSSLSSCLSRCPLAAARAQCSRRERRARVGAIATACALGLSTMLLSALAAGCGPGKSQLLRAKAVTDLGCAEDKLATDNLIPYVENVSGCGKQDVYAWDGKLDRWISLRERAAFELGCDRNAIDITVLDTMTYGAAGCEQRVVYKFLWMEGFVANSAASDATTPRSSVQSS